MTRTTMDLVHSYVSEYPNATCGAKERAALEQRIKELEADAKRYQFLREGTFTGQWLLSNVAGTWAVGMDTAIDRAMSEAALDKMREISEELKPL